MERIINLKNEDYQIIYNLVHLILDELEVASDHFQELNDLLEEKF